MSCLVLSISLLSGVLPTGIAGTELTWLVTRFVLVSRVSQLHVTGRGLLRVFHVLKEHPLCCALSQPQSHCYDIRVDLANARLSDLRGLSAR